MRKALVIGINNYPGAKLDCCVNDAKSVCELLARHYNDEVNFSVKSVLVDISDKIENGAKDNLKKDIVELFANDDDIALLYFSGHGYSDSTGEYICSTDFTPMSPGVKLEEILGIVQNSRCKNKIIILDSCFSGGMGDSPLFSNDVSVLGKGVTILSASRKDECSVEIGGHGLFTSLLIQALEGGAADLVGNVTPGSIYSFIDKALGAWEQRPLFKTNVQEFVSLRKVKAPIEIQDLRELPKIFASSSIEKNLNPSYEYTNDPNNPDLQPNYTEPYADADNVKVMKLLQRFERNGLVVPVGVQHMYFAAMESKSCKLTPLGEYYLMLAKKKQL